MVNRTTTNNKKPVFEKTRRILFDNTLYIVIISIFIVMVIINPKIMQLGNIEFIIVQASTRVILALGMAGIIILGHIDVSLGRVVGFAGVIVASLTQAADYVRRIFVEMPALPIFIPIIGVMLICGLIMLALSVFIAKLQIPAFIASLAFTLIVLGLASMYADWTNDLGPIGGLNNAFKNFGQGSINIGQFRIAYLVIYAIIITAIIWFIWNKTKLGKYMFAVGGNVEAANVSGVNISGTIMIMFFIAGLLYGLGGILETARVGSATIQLGFGYELDAIAACVVGGVSMRGGIGKVQGIIIGVLIFQLLSYGLVFLGVNPYIQNLVKGLIILLAVSVDTQKNRSRL